MATRSPIARTLGCLKGVAASIDLVSVGTVGWDLQNRGENDQARLDPGLKAPAAAPRLRQAEGARAADDRAAEVTISFAWCSARRPW